MPGNDSVDFPTLETEAGISPREREEIRAEIETVATENRIPVEAAQFSLRDARRGLLLPFVVIATAAAAVVIALLVLNLVFRQGENRLQTQATQYASVEGKLIRELRQESRQLLSSKEKEIEQVRGRLRELEEQQKVLEQTFAERLKQKEEEFKRQLRQEIDAERARLISQGVGQADVDRRVKEFEAERKAYYERQLVEFRKKLDAERTQLQADIDRLRSEYSSRLDRLQREQRQIVSDYEKREAALRVQLDQKTQVMDRLRTQSTVDLEAAQKELARLGRRQEQVQSVENQIGGQVSRIREAVAGGDAAAALARVRALQDYLRQDSVRSVSQLADRVAAEAFLLGQLGGLLEERIRAQAAGQSLTAELEILGQVHRLAQEAARAPAGPARLDAFRRVVQAIPEIGSAAAALVAAASTQAVEDDREKVRSEAQAAIEAAVASARAGDYATALERYRAAVAATPALAPDTERVLSDLLTIGYSVSGYLRTGNKDAATRAVAARTSVDLEADREAFRRQIADAVAARERELTAQSAEARSAADRKMTDALAAQAEDLRRQLAQAQARTDQVAAERSQLAAERSQVEARLQADRVKELDALAAQVKTTRQELGKRLDALLAFEAQVGAARSSFSRYADQEKAARQANPEDPITASRQELNKFLRDEPVRQLFPDIGDRVNALYAATQTAGSSAALADAEDIVASVAKQPTLKASRQLLQYEIGNAQGSERLKAILTAIDGVLSRAQASSGQ